jgi:hypothetical protein
MQDWGMIYLEEIHHVEQWGLCVQHDLFQLGHTRARGIRPQ